MNWPFLSKKRTRQVYEHAWRAICDFFAECCTIELSVGICRFLVAANAFGMLQHNMIIITSRCLQFNHHEQRV